MRLIATEMGGGEHITTIAQDDTAPWAGCSTPRLQVVLDLHPLPAMASTTADIARYFGRSVRDWNEVAFEYTTALTRGARRIQRVDYRLVNGRAEWVAFRAWRLFKITLPKRFWPAGV